MKEVFLREKILCQTVFGANLQTLGGINPIKHEVPGAFCKYNSVQFCTDFRFAHFVHFVYFVPFRGGLEMALIMGASVQADHLATNARQRMSTWNTKR